MSEAKEQIIRFIASDPDDYTATFTRDEVALLLATLDASRAREKALEEERDALKHDLERHVSIASEAVAREKALVEALRHARDQIRHPDQLINEALAPYSTPSPEAPSDVHPQGE